MIFSGVVLEGEVIDDVNVTDNDTSDIENFTLPMNYISLIVTGPTLLYFYSDLAKEDAGFFIEYWYVVNVPAADAAMDKNQYNLCVFSEVLEMHSLESSLFIE